MLWWNWAWQFFPIRALFYCSAAGIFSLSLLFNSSLNFVTILYRPNGFQLSFSNSLVWEESFNSTIEYIDAVISYCNGSEPNFLEGLQAVRAKGVKLKDSATQNRFEDHNDLKILLRSIEKNGQIFRHVYLILSSPDQMPYWLNTSSPRLRVVYHRDIWTDPTQLPIFNSIAIEANLHHIPGLSNVFVYFNDDFSLTSPVRVEDFVLLDQRKRLKAVRIRMDIPIPFGYEPSPTSLDATWVRPAVETRKLIDQICPESKKSLLAHGHIQHHSPSVFTRSALYHAESNSILQPQFRRTSGTKLRNGTELNVYVLFNGYAQCQLGYQTVWGRKSEILYIGINKAMEDPNYFVNMASVTSHYGKRVRNGQVKFLCLNDVTESHNSTETGLKAAEIAYNWRESLFPNKSSFEWL